MDDATKGRYAIEYQEASRGWRVYTASDDKIEILRLWKSLHAMTVQAPIRLVGIGTRELADLLAESA